MKVDIIGKCLQQTLCNTYIQSVYIVYLSGVICLSCQPGSSSDCCQCFRPVFVSVSACSSICHHKEPRNRYADTEDCPDIVLFDSKSGHDVELSISLARPWSLDTIRRAGEKNSYDDSKR